MIDKIGATAGVLSTGIGKGVGPAGAGGSASGDFGSMLMGFVNQAVENVHAGEKAAIDGLSGKAPLQEVVDKVMTAEQSLQAAIAVRDKIVAAYLEISRMTI